MKTKLIERLKKVMEQRDISNAELCRRTGLRSSSISDWLNGKYEPKQDKIEILAKALGVKAAWLMGYGNDDDDDEFIAQRIPILGRVVAGIPVEAIQEIEGYEEIDRRKFPDGSYFALRIKGASMEPVLQEGDIVIVRCQEDVDSGSIAIVFINGNDATCKQIKKSESGITLIGYNLAAYSPTFYSNEDIETLPIRVIGKVVEARHSFE